MKGIIIANYILNSISLCLLLIIFTILIIKKLYHNMLSEFMIYIIVSEMINSSSKYLSFLWNSCFDKTPGKNCLYVTLPGNIQIYLNIFSDILSVITCLLIAIKIYDTFNNNSLFFKQRKNILITRVIVFFFSFIISGTLGTIQLFSYGHYDDPSKPFSSQGKCFQLNCTLANDLNSVLVGILVSILLFILIINICNCCFLSKQSRRLNAQKMNLLNEKTLNQITIVKWRIMTFPLVSLLFYAFFYMDKVINIFMSDYLRQKKWLQDLTGYMFTIGDGLRGIMFSALVIWSLPDLYNIIVNSLCNKKLESIDSLIDGL